LDTVSTTSR